MNVRVFTLSLSLSYIYLSWVREHRGGVEWYVSIHMFVLYYISVPVKKTVSMELKQSVGL